MLGRFDLRDRMGEVLQAAEKPSGLSFRGVPI
jgi:hypothetical protein